MSVFADNFDDYWRVASKITPTTAPNRPSSPPPVPPSSASVHGRPASSTETQQEKEGAYSVRSVPVRVYLPDGPVVQELVPPVLEDGKRRPSFLIPFGNNKDFLFLRRYNTHPLALPIQLPPTALPTSPTPRRTHPPFSLRLLPPPATAPRASQSGLCHHPRGASPA